MAGSSCRGLGDPSIDQRRVPPPRLGSKIPLDSPLNDFLCCSCSLPVISARQTSCGCRLCEPCFLQYQRNSTRTNFPCNKCNLPFDINQTFRDRASDNELKRRSFPCYYSDCPWLGSAFDYRDHIAVCVHKDTICPNPGCKQTISRRQRKEHEATCPFRTSVCQWCKKEITFNELKNHEVYDCLEFSVSCLSGCGAKIRRKEMKDHIDRFCKKQTHPCSFMRYGCKMKGNSEALEIHSKEWLMQHLEMLSKFVSENCSSSERGSPLLEEGISEAAAQGSRRISRVQSEIRVMEAELKSRNSQLSSKLEAVTISLSDVQESLQELSVLVQTLQATCYNGQFIWKIPEVKRRVEDAMMGRTLSLYSAPFYTGRFGYKLCLRVYLNGDGSGKGTHISFFLTLMKGEYDALLSWPFSQMVTLSLLDQSKRKKHVTQCFKPEPSSSSFWRPSSDMNIASGCPKFAPLSLLKDLSYVQDDVMFFKATIDLTGLTQP